jgi:hypothetical protein
MHRDKITRMGSSIDTRPPAAMPHLTLYGRDYAAKKRATTEAAFADLKMIQSIAKTMTRKQQMPERSGPVSLNAETRKTEIFRIMKENHRLLDKLENLDPVVSTTDLLRQHKERHRYTILTSHSKRLAGEYDNDVMRIKTEDKAKTESYYRSVQIRKERLQRSQGSMSAPSLTPMAATDPGPLSTGSASPAPKHGKPVVTKKLGSTGGSSSSMASPPGGARQPAEADRGAAKRDSKVQFLNGVESPSDNRSEWERKGGPTPHPKKIPSELVYKDDAEVDEVGVRGQEVSREIEMPEAAGYEATAAPAAGYEAPAPAAAETAPDAAPAKEFDPGQADDMVVTGDKPADPVDDKPADDMVFTGDFAQPPAVGVAGSPVSPAGAGESYSQDYTQEFPDDSMSKAMDSSKALDDTYEATFDDSKDS